MASHQHPQPDPLAKAELQRRWDILAPNYNKADWIIEHLLGVKHLRRELLARASGDVLEVACGTGSNFPFYNGHTTLTAVDLSPGMLDQARRRANQLDLAVDLQVMDAESLAFPDASFDTVISSLSTCTVPDPVLQLREMARVCRADGRILLIEHGRSRWRWFAWYQDHTVGSALSIVGCRWNQNPFALAQEAGLRVLDSRRTGAGVFYTIEAAPRSLP
jgi:ubiquinone/menaquinone biosynthesis C-methylase UbiE